MVSHLPGGTVATTWAGPVLSGLSTATRLLSAPAPSAPGLSAPAPPVTAALAPLRGGHPSEHDLATRGRA